jgi:hypothetical protein
MRLARKLEDVLERNKVILQSLLLLAIASEEMRLSCGFAPRSGNVFRAGISKL